MTKTIPPASCSATNTTEADSQGSCASENSCDELGSMNVEVSIAVNFLTCLLMKTQLSIESTSLFRFNFTSLLKRHYHGHWYPNEPLKGSGYRCLRVNAVMHPLLIEAAQICQLPLKKMRQAFPNELTVWVDPGDVSVRFGEHGSIGVLYRQLDGMYSNRRSNLVVNERSYAFRTINKEESDCVKENSTKVWNGGGRNEEDDLKLSPVCSGSKSFFTSGVKRQLKL